MSTATNTAEKFDDPITALLEQYRASGANILLPSTRIEGLSEFHAPVVDTVLLSTKIEDGDIYKQGYGSDSEESDKEDPKQKYALTAQAIKKLSACAGIMWHPTETRRTDNRNDRNYVSYQAVAGIRKADGSPIYFKAEYDLDLEVIEDEITQGYDKKRNKWRKQKWFQDMTTERQDDYIDSCITRDLLQKRKHKLKLAETGAVTRVARSLLGLKSLYTLEELRHPFVVVRIVLRPNYKDPDVKRAMIAFSLQSMGSVYGSNAAALPAPPDFPKGEIIDLPHDAENAEDPDDMPECDMPQGGEPTDEEKLAIKREEFLVQTPNEQITTLEQLIKTKAYDVKLLKKSLKDFDQYNRLGFYDKLMAMPDAQFDF